MIPGPGIHECWLVNGVVTHGTVHPPPPSPHFLFTFSQCFVRNRESNDTSTAWTFSLARVVMLAKSLVGTAFSKGGSSVLYGRYFLFREGGA